MSPNDADRMANSVDPDQTAPLGAVWPGSALFAQAYLSENLGSLRLPYLDSAAFIIRTAAHTHQICFKADSRNVRYAEKFYTAGVIRVWVFWQSTGQIIGIHDPTPF